MILSLLFFCVGLYEIGGGYLFRLRLREAKSIWLGMLILAIYRVVLLQPVNFGPAYAGHSGVLMVDRTAPDWYSWLGTWIALLGVFVIM